MCSVGAACSIKLLIWPSAGTASRIFRIRPMRMRRSWIAHPELRNVKREDVIREHETGFRGKGITFRGDVTSPYSRFTSSLFTFRLLRFAFPDSSVARHA